MIVCRSAAELKRLATVNELVARVLAELEGMVKPGVTTADLDALAEQRLREAGLLDVARVRRTWREHLSGNFNWQYPLWDVLMLEAWRERWLKTA